MFLPEASLSSFRVFFSEGDFLFKTAISHLFVQATYLGGCVFYRICFKNDWLGKEHRRPTLKFTFFRKSYIYAQVWALMMSNYHILLSYTSACSVKKFLVKRCSMNYHFMQDNVLFQTTTISIVAVIKQKTILEMSLITCFMKDI